MCFSPVADRHSLDEVASLANGEALGRIGHEEIAVAFAAVPLVAETVGLPEVVSWGPPA